MSKRKTISFYRGRLPHWEVEHGVYFVTVRLHGVLPLQCIQALKELAAEIDRSEGPAKEKLQRRTFAILEHYLHNSTAKAYLTEPRVAAAVTESIAHMRAAGLWEAFEYVIMPNHLHLLFAVTGGSLRSTMLSFKRWTARQAKTILSLSELHFWQNESFDHWVRSDAEFEKTIEYIRMNPVKARLANDYRDWPYGSWNQQRDDSEK
jgi:REP element-mobilizing transposase RayT